MTKQTIDKPPSLRATLRRIAARVAWVKTDTKGEVPQCLTRIANLCRVALATPAPPDYKAQRDRLLVDWKAMRNTLVIVYNTKMGCETSRIAKKALDELDERERAATAAATD